MAQKYGVLREEGYSERALFVVDKEGIVRYVDIHDIGDQPDNEQVFQVLRQLEPDAVIPAEQVTAEPVSTPSAVHRAKPQSVILYCRPGCIDCRLARRFLESKGVPYTEVNVLTSPEAEARVRRWTGGPLITPVFDIDGTIVVDFKQSELRAVLGLEPGE